MNFADKVLSYRAKYNLTQKKMAKLCKVTIPTLHRVELGYDVSRISTKKIELVVNKDVNL